MANYLFLFTFGPVQSFIAQARKTQDLYGSSKLLADLSNHLREEVESKFSGKVIFATHRILAEVNTEDIHSMGILLEKTARSWLKTLATMSFTQKKPNGFDEQIENALEFSWAAVPRTDDYATDFSKVNKLLAAVKNTRTFRQIDEKSGRKCAISGQRNALFFRKTAAAHNPKGVISDAVEISESNLLNPGEAVDAVSLIKRLYGRKKGFPSVAEIALGESYDPGNPKIKEYQKLFTDFDPQMLFEESLSENYIKRHQVLKAKISLDKARSIRKELEREAEASGKPFCKYYAVLMMDGDSMGQWLSGEKFRGNSNFSKDNLREFHDHVKSQMDEFAEKVRDYFSYGNKGKLIYSGGDDVLAFLNLKYLFESLKFFRREYPDIDGTKSLTASAGLVIAHYKTPLAEVLGQVRLAEEKAKKTDGKDALTMRVIKHSGEIEEVCLKWDQYINNDLMLNIIHDIQSHLVSTRIFGKLHDLLSPFSVEKAAKNQEDDHCSDAMLETLVKVAIKSSISEEKDKDMLENVIEHFKLAQRDIPPLSSFLSFLRVTNFVGRAVS